MMSYQLSFAEELDDTLSQMFGVDFNALVLTLQYISSSFHFPVSSFG